MKNDTQIAGKKILLVEDDKFLSGLIGRGLIESRCVFKNALSGEDAISILEKEKPDAVILDLLLPGKVDGFGVLEKIRANHDLKDVPVIILSNLGSPEDIERGMRLGATNYLIKASIVPDEIIDHLVEAFAKVSGGK